jgi:hypothetical protein
VGDKKSLYIESTIPSYATGKDSADVISAGKQAVTKRFWEQERQKFELYTSQYTRAENSRGDQEAAKKRLDWLDGIPVLPETEELVRLAKIYQEILKIPCKAEVDCSHLAICVLNRIDYLLTWNFTHLGTAAQMKAKVYNDAYGLWTPVLVTPETMYGFMEDDVCGH